MQLLIHSCRSFLSQKDSPRYIEAELVTALLGKLRENLAKLVSWQEVTIARQTEGQQRISSRLGKSESTLKHNTRLHCQPQGC